MKVLGVSGRYGDAAAALAVDGRLVAAASEDWFTRISGIGYDQTDGFPMSAVRACLDAAGLELRDLDQLTVVGDEEPRNAGIAETPHQKPSTLGSPAAVSIQAIGADAVHAALSAPTADAVLVFSTRPAAIASFVRDGAQVRLHRQVSGGDRLMFAARAIAARLGVDDPDPCRGIDRLSVGGEPEFQEEFAALIRWDDQLKAVAVDENQLSALTAGACRGDVGYADDSLNARSEQRRRATAASFTCQVAHVLRDVAENIAGSRGAESVAFGGAMFGNVRLNTELRRLVGDAFASARVPEPAGRALGAALPQCRDAVLPDSLALGPAFSDADIKRTLDNCRLDYIYEPDRSRLLGRVSKLLGQGKVVAWFQGPTGFGPRAMGTRSVLCDPSGRYARHNVNEYLRHVPLDEPVPVVFAPSVAARCLTRPVSAALTVMDAAVNRDWRDRLKGALDWREFVRVHTVGPSHAPDLCDLLEHHYAHTGIPALIETNLCGPGEPIACTPRDAVKTVYSSAIDALVIGRFFLMKDYWLLKSHAD